MARRTPRRGNLPAARNGTIGQPSKLTAATEDAIVKAVLAGNHLTAACHTAGIANRTMYRWLEVADTIEEQIETGQPVDPDALPYLRFRQRLADARAQAEMRAVHVVQKAMQGGYVTSERPVQDVNGDPVRGDDGKILYERTWAQPDGRLALSYLARSRPAEWGQNSTQRVELTGGGGGPVRVEHTDDQYASLAARLAETAEQMRREEAEDTEEPFDGEVVDDSEEPM